MHWLMGRGTFELHKSEIAGVPSCLIACIFTSGLRAARVGNNLPNPSLHNMTILVKLIKLLTAL
jgi:hypothetical protein